jgi:hypothetical protein
LLGAQRRARLRIWLTIYNRQMTNDNRIGAKRARFCHRCVVKTSGIPVLLGPPPQQKNEFCTFEPCLHLRAQNRSRMPANFVQSCATLGQNARIMSELHARKWLVFRMAHHWSQTQFRILSTEIEYAFSRTEFPLLEVYRVFKFQNRPQARNRGIDRTSRGGQTMSVHAYKKLL